MLLGWSVMHVQQTKCEKCEKARITLKEFENASAFSNCTEHKDMIIYQDDHALYSLR